MVRFEVKDSSGFVKKAKFEKAVGQSFNIMELEKRSVQGADAANNFGSVVRHHSAQKPNYEDEQSAARWRNPSF